MKDGFYLSAYIDIDETAHLTRLKVRHDQNISLWEKKGDKIRLVHYWELERLTGFKRHNVSFYSVEQALRLIDDLLIQHQLSFQDIIQVWGTPKLPNYVMSIPEHELNGLSYHSAAHLFSALFFDTDIFYSDNILALAVDGGPDRVVDTNALEKNYYSGCVSIKGKIDMFPVSSPGLIWVYLRKKYFNLREGTLMALAQASKSELYRPEEEALRLEKQDDWSKIVKYVDKLVEDAMKLTKKDTGILFSGFDDRFTEEENKISMVMKEIQTMSYKIMEKNITDIVQKFKLRTEDFYLALSGGYALNCPTNSKLMEKFRFKGFIAPPNVNDAGLSLGIALLSFYKQMDHFNFNMRHAYYGDKDTDLNGILENSKYQKHIYSVNDLELCQVVADIRHSPIIWFYGGAEVGPRALGNRSILADPTTQDSKDRLNNVKQRQWWRPVAPIVLEEDIQEWFEESYPSPFMLQTFRIKEDKIQKVPAIAHLDNSARIQTLNENDHPVLYQVVKAFKDATGIPIVCNTSLNDRDEPIINTIEETLNFALRKQFDVAYINGTRISLKNHNEFEESRPCLRPFHSFCLSKEETDRRLKELNPYCVPNEILAFYYNNPYLKRKYSLLKKDDVRAITLYASIQKTKMKVILGV